jgi:hypothetical protein
MNGFAVLLGRIEDFIKRFYLNRLLRGGLLFIGLILATFLLLVNLEYFALLSIGFRTALFFGFISFVLVLFWYFILDPILKINKVGKRLSYEEAGRMIGRIIPGIEDKILNTLQLSSIHDNNLALAAIEQKSSELSRYPFSSAVDFKENKRYVLWILPVLLVFLSFLIFNPNVLMTGSKRLVNYNQVYLPEAPFDFVLLNDLDPVEEGSDVALKLRLKGSDIPSKVFVQTNMGKFLMNRIAKNDFELIVPKLRKDLVFSFIASDFESGNYALPVYGTSALQTLRMELFYPGYTGRQNEILDNPVMLSIPVGTKIRFSGYVKNGKNFSYVFGDSVCPVSESLALERRFFGSSLFTLNWKNRFSNADMNIEKSLEVIPDLYPSIDLVRSSDTLNERLLFFNGDVRDDYGVSALNFMLEVKTPDSKVTVTKVAIPSLMRLNGRFFHMLDLNSLNLRAGDVLTYYFDVYDNDGVHGPKRSSSVRYEFSVPTDEELVEQRQEALSSAQGGLSDVQKEMERFQRSLEELRKANLNKNVQSWKKKEMLDRLKLQHNQLQQTLQQEQQKLDESIKDQERFSEVDEELLNKQEELDKLLEQLMDSELKELLEKLQELMEKNSQQQVEELMDNFELSNEQMKNQLDRSMEMLKRMEVEERMDKAISNLDDLQKRQEELSKVANPDEKLKQDLLSDEFKKLSDELDSIKAKNEGLKKPMDLDMLESVQEEIEKSMQEAQDNLDGAKDTKANSSQKKAADKMKEMQQSLSSQSEAQKKKEVGENLETLRGILFNLMRLSFRQEQIMLDMQKVLVADPGFVLLTREQKRVIDDHVVVKDSLIALAARVPNISGLIDQELRVISLNFKNVVPNIHERKLRDISINQQYVMTSYNNLALMLNEALSQMQQEMQNMSESSGSGSCDKPGGKGKKPSDSESLGNMKEKLKKQLEQMQKGQNPGDKPGDKRGDKNPGSSGSPGSSGTPSLPGMSSEQVAKMAAEQSMMRKQLEQMRNELEQGGQGNGEAMNSLIDELDKQEKDLINQNYRNLVKRQQEILTRLLDSEKAIMEREMDDKRESKSAKDDFERNLIRYEEYKMKKLSEVELLRLQTPGLNVYYRMKASAYYNRVLTD